MISRRALLAGLAVAGVSQWPSTLSANETAPISLLDQARRLSADPYIPHQGSLPPPFDGLDYNAYRGIRPLPNKAAMLPQGSDFAADLLPPGLYFPDPVKIERRVGDVWEDQPFSPDLFDFDARYFEEIPETTPDAGFSGVRLRYPINVPDVLDEIAVFQGASYFRAIGRDMAYGLSARAVALGTGGAAPEEFPRFTKLRVDEGRSGRIRVEGLIDSPSLAGHIYLTLTPGTDTVMDVSVTLFPRRRIETVGIAPLTSMFLKGVMHAAVSDDFRPRVHDSDVLFIENGPGEQLWRPIANPAGVEASAFTDEGPISFGLFQSARNFDRFEDTEARYQDRPSAIVRPKGNWGAGAVMLVEIPTADEFMDNVVAFWRPEMPLAAGGEYRFDYQLIWTKRAPQQATQAPIVQSRSGREHHLPGTRRFVVDFGGSSAGLQPDVSAAGTDGEVLSGLSHFPLPSERSGSRVTFLLTPGEADVLELRLVLRNGAGIAASPVWLHRWTRMRDGGV